MMAKNVSAGGTKQSGQNAFTQLIVYNGSQQIMKNNTMMERFCVALTSRLRAAPSTRNMVPLCGLVDDKAMRCIEPVVVLRVIPDELMVTVCFTCEETDTKHVLNNNNN